MPRPKPSRRPASAHRLVAAELLESRVLLSGQTITGSLWNDQDADGVRDPGEPGLPGRAVYIDVDNDGRIDAGEPTAVTDGNGGYAFGGLAVGTYIVRQILPDGWRQSSPGVGSPASTFVSLTGHRDLVLDETRGLLYVTTDRGVVEVIDLATGNRLAAFNVGTTLLGADLTPDGRALYIAEGQTSGGQGIVRRVELADGTVTNLAYGRAFGEAGAYDIAIGANGRGMLTTRYSGSGWTPLRKLDTATDTLTAVTEPHGRVRQDTQIHRSGDGSLFFLTESNSSAGPIFTYDVATGSFPRSAETQTYLGSVRSAVNRDGSLIATEIGGVSIMDRDFRAVENLGGVSGGFAFDPTKDVFYALDTSDTANDFVVAFDTRTWQELYRFRVGENVTHGGAFGSGTIRVTADGRRLVLATPSGVRIFDLVARSGGRTATVTTSAGVQDIDFGSFAERTPEVRISDATVIEGPWGTRQAALTVTLSEPTDQSVRVIYATSDGSATAGDRDYFSAAGAVTCAPGETTKTIVVSILGEEKDELDERLLVNLMRATGAVIADGQGVVTIRNDDAGTRGSVSGALWNDADGNGTRDAGEGPLAGWTVYIDADNDGRLDAGELTAVTGSDGRYTFAGLPAGEYTVAQVLPNGWQQTSNRGLAGVAGQAFFLPSGTDANPLYRYRDLVYDAARHQLLIATADGTVERLDLTDMRLLDSFAVGNSLLGADITPDGTSLYVAESVRNVTQGFVRKVDLADGSVTNLAYDLKSLESGAYDVAIGANGTALVTTLFAGSGWTPLRRLDTATDAFSSIRQIMQDTDLYRSPDRRRMLLLEANISSGPVHVYDVASGTFPASIATQTFVNYYPAAVSRDGSLNAIGINGLRIYDANLQPLPSPTLTDRTTGLAFDPTRDLLYRAGETEITVYETDGFTELFRFPIGETLDRGKVPMAVSADGRLLFLGTDAGVRVYRLVTDARRVSLTAGQAVTDVDFSNRSLVDNRRPDAADDAFSATENKTLTGTLLANDSDADGDPLSVTAVNGNVAAVGSPIVLPSGAMLTVNADGTFVFDTAGAFDDLAAGRTEVVTFTYGVSDGWGGMATATVTVAVTGTNDGPSAVADVAATPENKAVSGTLLANDSDPDGDRMTVTAVNGEAAAVGQAVTLASGARLTVHADGTFAYDPARAFRSLKQGETAADSFTYTVADGHGGAATAVVTVTVRGVGVPIGLVAAPGAGYEPLVTVYDPTGSVVRLQFHAYPLTFRGGVRVAVGDVSGDGTDDIITAPARGVAPVRVFDGRSGAILWSFFAFPENPYFGGGITLAVADVNRDEAADVILSVARGSGPAVRVVDGRTGGELSRFWAFIENPTFGGGVNLAAGDVDGDGDAEVIAAIARGAGPAVRVLEPLSGRIVSKFWAFAENPGFRGGVNVAAGDVDGDGRAEVIAAIAGGAGPVVRVLEPLSGRIVSNFWAFPENPVFLGGVSVGVTDVDRDGRAEVLAVPATGAQATVRFIDPLSGRLLRATQAYPAGFTGGAFLAGQTFPAPAVPQAARPAAEAEPEVPAGPEDPREEVAPPPAARRVSMENLDGLFADGLAEELLAV